MSSLCVKKPSEWGRRLTESTRVPHSSPSPSSCYEIGRQLTPWTIERTMRAARTKVADLPAGFRFHDLRHYFASLLIASGADVEVVQARMRHASAKTTLDTYGDL